MAAVRSSTGDIQQSSDATFVTGGDAVTGSFDAGTDADRLLVINISWNTAGGFTLADNAVTYNGVALTPKGATNTLFGAAMRSYELVAPDTGSNTWSVDPSTGSVDVPAIVAVHCYSGVNQGTPSDGYAAATGSDAAAPLESTCTVSSETDDMVHLAHMTAANGVSAGAATGFTERTDNVIDSGTLDIGMVTGNEPGAASVATTVTWTSPSSLRWITHGWNLNAAAVSAVASGGSYLDYYRRIVQEAA